MRNRSKLFLGVSLAVATAALADLAGSYVVPLDDEAIRYATRPADDPVERLNRKIARGEVKLEFDDAHGYLRSVLRALGIPVESQVLVFSKTSFQAAAHLARAGRGRCISMTRLRSARYIRVTCSNSLRSIRSWA